MTLTRITRLPPPNPWPAIALLVGSLLLAVIGWHGSTPASRRHCHAWVSHTWVTSDRPLGIAGAQTRSWFVPVVGSWIVLVTVTSEEGCMATEDDYEPCGVQHTPRGEGCELVTAECARPRGHSPPAPGGCHGMPIATSPPLPGLPSLPGELEIDAAARPHLTPLGCRCGGEPVGACSRCGAPLCAGCAKAHENHHDDAPGTPDPLQPPTPVAVPSEPEEWLPLPARKRWPS